MEKRMKLGDEKTFYVVQYSELNQPRDRTGDPREPVGDRFYTPEYKQTDNILEAAWFEEESTSEMMDFKRAIKQAAIQATGKDPILVHVRMRVGIKPENY